jgi:hypothetical protein
MTMICMTRQRRPRSPVGLKPGRPRHMSLMYSRSTRAVKGMYVTVQTNGHPHFHDQDIASCVWAPNGKWF